MIPMLLLISFIVYFGLQLTGIDPINFMVSPEMLSSNKENVEALRQSLGLNDPMIVQYFRWLGNCLHGDFGYSLKEGSSIASIIAVRLPYTFELAGYSLIFSAIIGVGIGIISAVRQNGIIDYVGRVLAVLGQAIPQFLVGIILIQIFCIKLGWFPSSNPCQSGCHKCSTGCVSAFIFTGTDSDNRYGCRTDALCQKYHAGCTEQ